MKKLKPPSRKIIRPLYKSKQVKPENDEPIILKLKKNKKYLKKIKTEKQDKKETKNFLNKRKINRFQGKIFKLSDFGLCTNIKNKTPSQFAGGDVLGPEICKLGPDSRNVSL
jgi:hypothetical protein